MMWTRTPTAIAGVALGLAVVFAAGCESRTEDSAAIADEAQAPLPEIVRKAVDVAKAIEANPDDIEAVLEAHALDVERFEEMMYEISSDPFLSKAYAAATE